MSAILARASLCCNVVRISSWLLEVPGVTLVARISTQPNVPLIGSLIDVELADIWGKRRLSYPIDKKPEGIYAVVDLTAEPGTVQELDRQLNLNEGVLRTKVLRPEHR